ncbi:MAG: creatininase family protein [Myxococcaceae bacterium]
MSFFDARALTWPKVSSLAKAGALALLPVGSTEAHGPHLPLSVDVVIAEEVCRRVAGKLSDKDFVMFPPVAYSLTDFAASFAGTVSVPAAAAEAALTAVLLGIAQHGFPLVAVVNHHLEPAHFSVVHRATKAAQAQTKVRLVAADHRRPPFGPKLGEEFMHGGSHAGSYETSLMIAAAPQLVDDGARKKLPELSIDLPAKIKGGAKNFVECGGADAYFGNPAKASRAEGDRLFEVLVEATVAALSDPPPGEAAK